MTAFPNAEPEYVSTVDLIRQAAHALSDAHDQRDRFVGGLLGDLAESGSAVATEPKRYAMIPGWRHAVLLSGATLGLPLRPEWRVGQQIRDRHPDAFNRDLWGQIIDVVLPYTGVRARPVLCYAVRWPDGGRDLWPVVDPVSDREFRETWVADA